MDKNEFDLDALLDCDAFARYESVETRCAMDDFLAAVKENTDDEKAVGKIKPYLDDLVYYIFNDAFKQGFCFAVKSIKFLLKC